MPFGVSAEYRFDSHISGWKRGRDKEREKEAHTREYKVFWDWSDILVLKCKLVRKICGRFDGLRLKYTAAFKIHHIIHLSYWEVDVTNTRKLILALAGCIKFKVWYVVRLKSSHGTLYRELRNALTLRLDKHYFSFLYSLPSLSRDVSIFIGFVANDCGNCCRRPWCITE